MEIRTHSFREANLVIQLMQEWQIKSKIVMRWSSRKKKEGNFCTVYFFLRLTFFNIFVLSQCIEY